MAFNWRRLIGLSTPSGNSTGLGPDFPGSGGDRERSKFRESDYPRLTMVAVCDDEGNPVGKSTDALLEEILRELRLIRTGIVVSGMAADLEDDIQT